MARECRELICLAPDDHRPRLHFLSPRILRAAPQALEPAVAACQWATGELARFQATGDTKLSARYERLVRYFNAHGFTVAPRVSVSGGRRREVLGRKLPRKDD
jgi:hypothetical protein